MPASLSSVPARARVSACVRMSSQMPRVRCVSRPGCVSRPRYAVMRRRYVMHSVHVCTLAHSLMHRMSPSCALCRLYVLERTLHAPSKKAADRRRRIVLCRSRTARARHPHT